MINVIDYGSWAGGAVGDRVLSATFASAAAAQQAVDKLLGATGEQDVDAALHDAQQQQRIAIAEVARIDFGCGDPVTLHTSGEGSIGLNVPKAARSRLAAILQAQFPTLLQARRTPVSLVRAALWPALLLVIMLCLAVIGLQDDSTNTPGRLAMTWRAPVAAGGLVGVMVSALWLLAALRARPSQMVLHRINTHSDSTIDAIADSIAGPTTDSPTDPAATATTADAPVVASPRSQSVVVQTIALTRTYGSLVALDRLNLTLERGDVFGFIGPNGAGKSTTMKIIAGLLDASAGTALVLGRDVATNGQFVRKNVGYMPDSFGVYDDLKVSEYLEFFASAYGLPRAQRRKVVGDVLELTDLSYKRDALVDSLSRGMQQRLGLARVLVHDPPILLLDEPASGLDPRARIEIRELLKELQRLGKTILVSSHILSELGEFCNKLGIIERGKLLVTGSIDELIARARIRPTVCIEPAPGDRQRAREVLSGDQRVQRVEEVDGQLLVTLSDQQPDATFLLQRLISAGVHLHSLAPQPVKLEEVFLRLTQGVVQ